MWYAMASAEFGGLRYAVKATTAPIAAQASVSAASNGRMANRGNVRRRANRKAASARIRSHATMTGPRRSR